MVQPLAVAFDCDGVLADNGSSWQAIHDAFETENKQMLAKFIAREIDDDEFMADDVAKWMEAKGRIHKDDIARCYGGIRLMPGAREVVGRLQERGVMVAIVLYSIPTIFRVVRASALVIKTQDFLTIAEVLGTSKLKVILAHYGLNILPVLSVQLVYSISLAMLLESALSFLGLGVQPPGASLGSLIRDSLLYLEFAPWLLLFPSITLSLIILSINQLADMADSLVQPKDIS